MYGVKRRFDSLPAVVAFVTALLLGLGYLQYRWTGALSEAERGRMRASLHDRASQLARDLDREVTRAFLWLQVDPGALHAADHAGFVERHDRWREIALSPAIVRDVYLTSAEAPDARQPMRYAPGGKVFEPASWPPELEAAREEWLRDLPGGTPRPRGPRFGPLALLADGTPVGLMPAPRFERLPGGGPRVPAGPILAGDPLREGREGPPVSFGVFRLAGFLVIVFDKDVIASDLLPRLVRRHFPDETAPAFDLKVRRRDRPGDIVYATGPTTRPEATVGLLELRPEEASEEDLRAMSGSFGSVRSGLGRGEGRPGVGRRGPDETPQAGVAFNIRPWASRMLRAGGGGPDDTGLWQLEVAYRDGSVETLVETARRRNLAVSFSVLLLLGAATVLLASAARRARRLAERQMEFVAAVSHELRTPVSVVCSAGENLADGVVVDREGVARYGALVRDEGRRLARLLEQVLDFAGGYTGRRSYRREPVSVEAVLDEALHAAAPSVRDAGFRVERVCADDLPALRGDAPALARAVRNLVENAVKYGGDDRLVTVRASAFAKVGRPWARIAVEDRGLGIPASEQKQLFEPFWRGAEATSRQIRGSGLGLALVQSIVGAHGGLVSVASEPGRGSVFTLDLPAAEGPPAPATDPAAHDSGAKKEDGKAHDLAHPAG